MAEREFDPITGVPVYPIRNCEYPVSCSYPYCSCRVPHDRYDQPMKARDGVDYTVLAWWVVIFVVLIIVETALVLQVWSWA